MDFGFLAFGVIVFGFLAFGVLVSVFWARTQIGPMGTHSNVILYFLLKRIYSDILDTS